MNDELHNPEGQPQEPLAEAAEVTSDVEKGPAPEQVAADAPSGVAVLQATLVAMQQELADLKAQLEAAKQREALPALMGNPTAGPSRPLTGLALIRAAIERG